MLNGPCVVSWDANTVSVLLTCTCSPVTETFLCGGFCSIHWASGEGTLDVTVLYGNGKGSSYVIGSSSVTDYYQSFVVDALASIQ